MLGNKLRFHRHVDYICSLALKLLRLIRFITYNFSSLDSLNVLYVVLILSKPDYAAVAWKNLTVAGCSELKIYRESLKASYYNRFIQSDFPRNYNSILNRLNFRTLHFRLQHLDALFLVNVFTNSP
jgi:hypothetical protein